MAKEHIGEGVVLSLADRSRQVLEAVEARLDELSALSEAADQEAEWWKGRGKTLLECYEGIAIAHTPWTRRDILGMLAAEMLPAGEAGNVVAAIPDKPPAGASETIWKGVSKAAYDYLVSAAQIAHVDQMDREKARVAPGPS